MTGFRKDQKFIQSVTFSKIVRENLNFQKMSWWDRPIASDSRFRWFLMIFLDILYFWKYTEAAWNNLEKLGTTMEILGTTQNYLDILRLVCENNIFLFRHHWFDISSRDRGVSPRNRPTASDSWFACFLMIFYVFFNVL